MSGERPVDQGRNLAEKPRLCPACEANASADDGPMNGWAMLRCSRCGLVYTAEVPSQDDLQKIYDRVYEPGQLYSMHLEELERLKKGQKVSQGFYRNRVFLHRFRPNPGDRLLEVGCGVGAFLVAAKNAGWAPEGVDLSEEVLRSSASVHGLPVHHGTLEDLPLPAGAYRAIVCWEVLEHLPYPGCFLRRVRDLLTGDGVFACSVPNSGRRVPRFVDQLGPASVPPIHLNFWDCTSFRAFSRANGFRPLYLAPKKSLRSLAGAREHRLRWFLNQIGALVGLREGGNVFAVLARDSGPVPPAEKG